MYNPTYYLALRAGKDGYQAFALAQKAEAVETRRLAKIALRKMQGQQLTTARMYAVADCIRAVVTGGGHYLPYWAKKPNPLL